MLADTNPFSSRLDAAVADAPPRPSVDPSAVAPAGRAVSRFCVVPLPDPIGLGPDDSRIDEFQALLVEELETDGFDVVDPDSVEETLKGALETPEPIYDPHTGRRSEARDKAARKHGWKSLALEHDCEFFLSPNLSPNVVRVSASWIDGRARWDGASEQVLTKSEFLSPEYFGHIEALSLHVRIVDASDELIYFGTDGIQLLAHLPHRFEGEYRIVHKGDLLADRDLNRTAIRLAIEPMRPEEVPR